MSFWKSLFGQSETILSPNVVETAFSLGDKLAMLQHVLSQGFESAKADQFKTVFRKSILEDAATLKVQVPPEYLNSAADPRVEKLSEQIAVKQGKVVAGFFRFSFQAKLANHLADMIAKGGPNMSLMAGIIGLNLDLCVTEATLAAKEIHADDEHLFKSKDGLKLMEDAVNEGKAIAMQVRALVRSGFEGQNQQLMDISGRLHRWWTKFSIGVPLELRLRKK